VRDTEVRVAADDLVLLTETLAAAPAAWLEARADVRVCSSHASQFFNLLEDARGLVVRTDTVVDTPLLLKAPRLAVVARAGAGLDNIDVDACRARAVQVVYAPDANTQAVVEYVLTIVLDRLRPRVRVRSVLDRERWQALRDGTVGTRELREMTVGILGLGRIGRGLARVLAALGADVLYNDLVEIPPADRHGAVPTTVEDLFARSDIVTIHIDGRAANRHFVGSPLLRCLKPDAVVVNTARGSVVEEMGLASFLREHPEACALLDVHEQEPIRAGSPLLHLPNALLFPHLAGRTRTSLDRMTWVVRDVVDVLEGRPPTYPAP
jgi:phosphoglycerate dehydrogenase-like enzyme